MLFRSDLAAVIRMIDTVSRRGAFEGSELSDVGTLRNRFVAFINANAPKQETPDTPAPISTPSEEKLEQDCSRSG